MASVATGRRSGLDSLGIFAFTTAVRQDVVVAPAQLKDVNRIVELINNEAKASGAVIEVTPADVEKWIRSGLSFVAKSGTKIVGHAAGHIWPQSGYVEHRSAVVLEAYRKQGINQKLTIVLVQTLMERDPSTVVISLKNANATEDAKSAVLKFGFKQVDVHSLPEEIFTLSASREDNIERYSAYLYQRSVKSLARN